MLDKTFEFKIEVDKGVRKLLVAIESGAEKQ